METSRGNTSGSVPPPKNSILDVSDASREVPLEDSQRSGGSDLIFPTRGSGLSSAHHMHTDESKMQKSTRIDESYREEDDDVAGDQAGDSIPIATPASTHGDSTRPSMSDRVRRDFVPPLPLGTIPGSFAGSSTSTAGATAVSANHISPATPMPRPHVGIASLSMMGSTPGSTPHSQDSRSALLAGLYQSSRRSRNNTPGQTTPGTGGSTRSSVMAPPMSFPPPPPLFSINTPGASSSDAPSSVQQQRSGTDSSTTTVPTQHLRGSQASSASATSRSGSGSDIHKVSLQSSTNTTSNRSLLQSSTMSGSTMLHESWNTSMRSLMTDSFMNTSLCGNVYNPRLSSASGGTSASQAMQGPGPVGAAGGRPTGERLSSCTGSYFPRHDRRPMNLMDYKIEDRTSNRHLSREQSSGSSSSATEESITLREATSGHPQRGRGHNKHHPRLQLNLMDYKLEDSDNEDNQDEDRKSPNPNMPTVPTLSGDSTLSSVQQDKKESLPVPSMRGLLEKTESTRCMEQMSKLQVRCSKRKGSDSSIDLDEEDEDTTEGEGKKLGNSAYKNQDEQEEMSSRNQDDTSASYTKNSTKGPPKKKNKMDDTVSATGAACKPALPEEQQQQYLTPVTHKSTMSSASFDIIAHHPSSRVSSIHTDVSPGDADMMEILKSNGIDDDVHVKEIFEVDDAEEERAFDALRIEREKQGQEEEPEEGQEKRVDTLVNAQESVDEKMQQDADDYRAAEPEPQLEVQFHRDETPSVKEQRILRRKIQRLLLIRHCSTCTIPPPPLVTIPSPPNNNITSSSTSGDQCLPCAADNTNVQEGKEAAQQQQQQQPPRSGNNNNPPPPPPPVVALVCPVTSHCAEGKALCAHIRSCKRTNCTYKKCLTSREVLGHYKNCRDRQCEICGPVRALDRSKSHHNGNHAKDNHSRRRRSSDSSIETIDDEGWLNDNMMESNHNCF